METADRERPAAATMSTHLSVLDSGAFSPTSQEIDLNQTQLRLVREQTSHCIRDLNALRAEVMLLKSEVESDRLSASAAASSMEGKQIEVQEHFERERRERDAVLQQLSRKVHDLDRELPPIRDEMSLVREQIRALETAWHPHIEDLQATFLKDVEARHQAHGQLEQRLFEIDAGMAKHSALHKDLQDRLQTTVHQEHVERLGREIQTHVAKVAEMQEHHANLRNHLESEKETKNKALEDLNSFMSQQLGRNLSAQSAPIQERLDYLEKLMGDSAARHARDLAAAHQKIQDHSFQSKGHVQEQMAYQTSLASRVEFLEKSLGDSAAKQGQELRDAHQKISDLHGLTEHSERKHSSLQERMDFIENLLGDNVQKHSEELKKTQDRLSELRGKLGVGMPGSMREGEIQVTVESRLKYLEQALGDSDAKHREELSHAHGKLEALHGRLGHLEVKGATLDELKHHCEKQGTALEDLKCSHANLSSDKSALDLHHARLKERVDYLETMMGDSTDHHKKAIEEHKANHAKLANELRAREASHATLADRMGYIEQRMGDSFEKHAQELAAAVAKMDAVHVRVSEERVAREAHVASLESLKKAHGSLASEKQALEKHHATLEERLDYLEKALGDSSDKHTRELEALKAAHQKVATEHKSKEQSHGQVADRLTQLQREKEDLHARHMLLGERVDYLEKLLGESAEKHTQEIEKFKAKHAKDLDASASKMQSHHAGLQERLEYLESKICDSADKHAKELSNMHAKMQELHGKLQDEKNHREEKLLHITGHFRDQISGEQKTREERHASIEERVKFLESAIGNNAATVDELKQKYEKQGTALEDLRSSHVNLSTGKSSLDSHHATLKERMDSLESMMGDSADNYNKVLQVHKADHAKLSNELHAHQANHATLADRMGYMEQLMGDSFEKHAKELAAAMAKMDAMHGKVSEERVASEELAAAKAMEAMRGQVSEERVAPREAHMASLESLKKAHGSVASQKQALETHHATLQERIDYLEKALGDSSDKHARELEALKAAHQKVLVEHKGKEQSLFQMQREKDELHARHMSLGERVDYLEKLLGESAEKHQQELEKFKGKHAKLDAGANKLQSHHDGLQERLEYLETKIGDSADQHAKELSNIQAKMQDLHSKLQDEKNREEEKLLHLTGYLREQVSAHKAREERHASMEERVKFLESLIRDTADKHKKGLEEHSKGVKALSEKHDRLEKMLGASAEKHAQEEAARLQVEELLRRETQERHKHHETQSELVDSLQRTVGIFDVLIRKDMEERKLEMKHIWEAIDGHTHDLSSKVKAIGSDTEDLEDETRLRPCVVARSSPSLPGVVSPSVRSGAGGANSPKVVTYRPAAVLPASQARIVYPSTVMQAPAPAPIALQSSTRSGLIAAPGRSLSPSRRIDHSEVVCGKARYQGERAHNAEIFRCHD